MLPSAVHTANNAHSLVCVILAYYLMEDLQLWKEDKSGCHYNARAQLLSMQVPGHGRGHDQNSQSLPLLTLEGEGVLSHTWRPTLSDYSAGRAEQR